MERTFSAFRNLWLYFAPHIFSPRQTLRFPLIFIFIFIVSVAISFILLLLGTGIVFSAMFDFKVGAEDVHNLSAGLLITMSLLFTIVFFLMTVVKLQMSVLLDSRALLKDGYCSLFGTILACSLFLNTIIIESIPRLWWLDPLVSLVVGIASLFIGLRSILIQSCEKKIPIWDPKWWIFSQGSMTMDEMEKVDEENKGEQQQQQQTTPSPPILYDDLDSNKNEDGMTDLSLDGSETKETEMTNIGDSSDGPKHNIEGPPSIL